MSPDITALSSEQLARLYAADTDARLSALVKLTIDTACRSSELSLLTWEDIDFEGSAVTIPGEFPRTLPLQSWTLDALTQWRTEAKPRRQSPLFCTIRGRCRPLGQRNLDILFTTAGQAAGVSSAVSAQAIRRSVCVQKMNAGMSAEDLQHFMGVKDRSSLKYYYQKTYACAPEPPTESKSPTSVHRPLPTHGGTWLAFALLAVAALAFQFAWRNFVRGSRRQRI